MRRALKLMWPRRELWKKFVRPCTLGVAVVLAVAGVNAQTSPFEKFEPDSAVTADQFKNLQEKLHTDLVVKPVGHVVALQPFRQIVRDIRSSSAAFITMKAGL